MLQGLEEDVLFPDRLLTYCLHRDKALLFILSLLRNPAIKHKAHSNEVLQFHC